MHPCFHCSRSKYVCHLRIDNPYYSNSKLELTLATGCLFRDVARHICPCGICRQVIHEFCALKMPILLVPAGYESANGNDALGLLETSLEELLPLSFGPDGPTQPRRQRI